MTWPDGAYSIYSDEEAANSWVARDGLGKSATVVPLHLYDEGPARGDRCNYAGCLRNRWFAVAPGEVSMFCEEHHRGLAQCGMTQKEEWLEDSMLPLKQVLAGMSKRLAWFARWQLSGHEEVSIDETCLSQLCADQKICVAALYRGHDRFAELTAKADRLEKRIMNAGHCSDAQWLELEKKMRRPAREQRKEEHHEQTNGNSESETADQAHGAARSGDNTAGQGG